MDFPHYDSLAGAITALFGSTAAIEKSERLSGGDINKAFALTLNNGERLFMKANARRDESFFTAEATGLSAIAQTAAIATPKIFCTGTDWTQCFLLLEYIESSRPRSGFWEDFAHELAAMHNADPGNFTAPAHFGFFQDNFIGSSPQKNTPAAKWIDFFRDQRLVPQFRTAEAYFTNADRAKITKLLDRLGDFLTEPEHPSLLHGDLWRGSLMCRSDGKAVLIDPAVSVGNAEADLAMTELFGGFPSSFYEAYREALPLQSGYEERRELYNLYQLLNHLNLFGSAYLHAVLGIVNKYVM